MINENSWGEHLFRRSRSLAPDRRDGQINRQCQLVYDFSYLIITQNKWGRQQY